MRIKLLVSATACLVLAVGCQPDVKPKGTGASGTLAAKSTETENAQSDGDLGLGLINKLTSAQQNSMEWLARPFDVATKVREDLSDEEQKKLEKIKKHWDSVEFASLEGVNGRKFVHLVTLQTDHGNLQFHFTSDYTPDYIRGFVTMAQLGMFDGVKLNKDGGVAWIGPKDQKPLYQLEASSYVPSFRAGVLFVPKEGEHADGTVFGLTLEPSPDLSTEASAFGGTVPTPGANNWQEVMDGLDEHGSVTIQKAIVDINSTNLFTGDSVSLVEVGADGKPIMRADGRPAGAPPEDPSQGN